MSTDPDLSKLSHAEKDALILALLARLDEAHRLIAELRARIDELTRPGKTPDNSSLPPSQGQKPNRPDKAPRQGPRAGSLGRQGGGRALAAEPDAVVIAKPARCRHCQAAFAADGHALAARYDKVDLPQVRPVVTRVEQYAGRCPCCGATTLAAVPEGLEPGTPFSLNIVALAMYLRFTHAVSYKRLSRLLLELFGLGISEGALEAAFRRARPQFDADVAAILARLRRARVVYSDETGVRIDGQGCWNWVFQNAEVVIHVVRRSRGAEVVTEVLAGHRPALWVSDLYGAQQGHAEAWQICLAHTIRTQLRSRLDGAAAARLRGAQWDDMADLQSAVADDDALDYELQDRLLVGERRLVQAAADAGAKRLQVAADCLSLNTLVA